MQDSPLIWAVALAAVVMGAICVGRPKLRFMAWPAFGVAGVLAGMQLQSDRITYASLVFTVASTFAQIVYDGWSRSRS